MPLASEVRLFQLTSTKKNEFFQQRVLLLAREYGIIKEGYRIKSKHQYRRIMISRTKPTVRTIAAELGVSADDYHACAERPPESQHGNPQAGARQGQGGRLRLSRQLPDRPAGARPERRDPLRRRQALFRQHPELLHASALFVPAAAEGRRAARPADRPECSRRSGSFRYSTTAAV